MLVSQTRVYDGSEIHEFPAGSIDFGQKPVDAAINELREKNYTLILNEKT